MAHSILYNEIAGQAKAEVKITIKRGTSVFETVKEMSGQEAIDFVTKHFGPKIAEVIMLPIDELTDPDLLPEKID